MELIGTMASLSLPEADIYICKHLHVNCTHMTNTMSNISHRGLSATREPDRMLPSWGGGLQVNAPICCSSIFWHFRKLYFQSHKNLEGSPEIFHATVVLYNTVLNLSVQYIQTGCGSVFTRYVLLLHI